MKRIIHTGFAIVILALSIGIIVNKHYSAGELYSIALLGEPESCCDMPCDCCDDESDLYQLTGDYIISNNIFEVADLEVISLIVCDEVCNYPSTKLDEYRAKEFRKDIHPPRKANYFLSKLQSYLL